MWIRDSLYTGDAARFVPLDVTDEAGWVDLLAVTTDEFGCPDAVSYTHLDVYKRQRCGSSA